MFFRSVHKLTHMKKIDYHCVTPDITTTASAMECTGLMYKPPVDTDEYESYQQLYGMEIPKLED